MDLVRFSEFCTFLDTLSSAHNSEIIRRHLSAFASEALARQTPLLHWIRLLLPEEDVQRTYALREYRLTQNLVKFMPICKQFITYLKEWTNPIPIPPHRAAASVNRRDPTAADFGLRLQLVLEESAVKLPHIHYPSQLTLEQLNSYLDDLARHSSYSDIDNQGAAHPTAQTWSMERDQILRNLFLPALPREVKWLVRIILGDLKLSSQVSVPKVMNAVHPFMYHIYLTRHFLSDACEHTQRMIMDDTSDSMQQLRQGVMIESAEYAKLRAKWVTPKLMSNIGIMKCKKAQGTNDAFIKMQGHRVASEIKYDGERIQVHFGLDRSINDETGAVEEMVIYNKSKRRSTYERVNCHNVLRSGLGLANPEVYTMLNHRPKERTESNTIHTCVIEGEILTYNEDAQSIEKFGAVGELQDKQGGVELTGRRHFLVVWFDLLYLNGHSMLSYSYESRRNRLMEVVDLIPRYVQVSEMHEFDFRMPASLSAFREHYAHVIGRCEEGVILKRMESEYTPGREGDWIKLKKDYIPGFGDTADFAIIGASLAKTTSTKFTRNQNTHGGLLGTFIVGCLMNKEACTRNKNVRPIFKAVFKVETGLSDQERRMFDERTRMLMSDGMLNRCDRIKGISLLAMAHYDIKVSPLVAESDFSCIFRKPYVFELLGAGFVKERGCSFYTLRFPRIVKIRGVVEWPDTISFDEMQDMAKVSFMPWSKSDVKRAMDTLERVDMDPKAETKFVRQDIDVGDCLDAFTNYSAPRGSLSSSRRSVSKPKTPPKTTSITLTPGSKRNRDSQLGMTLQGLFDQCRILVHPRDLMLPRSKQYPHFVDFGMSMEGQRLRNVVSTLEAIFISSGWKLPMSEAKKQQQQKAYWNILPGVIFVDPSEHKNDADYVLQRVKEMEAEEKAHVDPEEIYVFDYRVILDCDEHAEELACENRYLLYSSYLRR